MPLEEYERMVANEGKQFEYTFSDQGVFIPVKLYIELVNAHPDYDSIDLLTDITKPDKFKHGFILGVIIVNVIWVISSLL